MKTSASVIVLACVLASASAFSPPLATRAVGKKAPPKKVAKKVVKKVAAKKAAPKKVVAPPSSGGYPSFRASTESWKPFSFSGGGNKAPPSTFSVPDFSDPKLQIDRDPAFYAAAAKTRTTKASEFVFDDGLTELERKQRSTIPTFLTGSAKSQADTTTIRSDVAGEEFAFGLDADRFQLLFISVFGLFTLVGCLSGNLQF